MTATPISSPRRLDARRRLVVVGNGMAGTRLVEELVARGGLDLWDVTVIGAEPQPSYNRILLSGVLAGTHREEDTQLLPADLYDSVGVTAHLGSRVTRIHRLSRTVHIDDGTVVPYDRLAFATGSRPLLPPVRGLVRHDGTLHPRVFGFRTLDDCAAILGAVGEVESANGQRAPRAVVVGGGLLGLEAARGLAGRGVSVEVVHLAPWLMNLQIDHDAGEVLRRTLERMGITTYLEAMATAVAWADERTLHGLRLADDHLLECDLVVFAAGVRPNTRLARDARIEVDQGVVVDEGLTSVTDPSVHAIGECAQAAGRVQGLVGPSWEHAAVLAERLSDPTSDVTYTGSKVVTRLKASGIDLAALGETEATPADSGDGLEVLAFSDYTRGVYKKVVLRDGRVTGGILLGEVSTAGTLSLAYERGSPLPPDRLTLLFAGTTGGVAARSAAELPDEATVCHCAGVTAGRIRGVLDACGPSCTVADVAAETRATTGCGTCSATVGELCALTSKKVEGAAA